MSLKEEFARAKGLPAGAFDYTWKNVKQSGEVKEKTPESPFTTEVRGEVVGVIASIHARRSPQARAADESFNAPVTSDEEKWRDNPNRYDYPGVDTVSHKTGAVRAARAVQRLRERGHLGAFSYEKIKHGGAYGQFFRTGRPVGTMKPIVEGSKYKMRTEERSGKPEIYVYKEKFDFLKEDTPGRIFTVAHESGHAIDWAKEPESYYTSTESAYEFAHSDKVKKAHKEAMVQTSVYMRGAYDQAKRERRVYRERGTELIADAFAAYIIEPRMAKREMRRDYFDVVKGAAEDILGPGWRKQPVKKAKKKRGSRDIDDVFEGLEFKL